MNLQGRVMLCALQHAPTMGFAVCTIQLVAPTRWFCCSYASRGHRSWPWRRDPRKTTDRASGDKSTWFCARNKFIVLNSYLSIGPNDSCKCWHLNPSLIGRKSPVNAAWSLAHKFVHSKSYRALFCYPLVWKQHSKLLNCAVKIIAVDARQWHEGMTEKQEHLWLCAFFFCLISSRFTEFHNANVCACQINYSSGRFSNGILCMHRACHFWQPCSAKMKAGFATRVLPPRVFP